MTSPPSSRLLDHVLVKGKTRPIEIFEVSDSCSKPNFEKIAQDYLEAFTWYRRGQFDVAERLFTRLAESANDTPSLVLMRRCAELRLHPPKLWEGVFRLETK
jgi:adenylate cyclase